MRLPGAVVRAWEVLVRVLVVGVASLALWGLVLGFVGAYEPAYVLAATLASTAVLGVGWHRLQPVAVDPDDRGLALLVGVLGSLALAAFHARHSGQFLLVTRDPAFFNLTAIELARGGDLVFRGVPDALAGVETLRFHGPGFAPGDGGTSIFAQGFHGLSATLAPARWIGGDGLLFRAAPVLGGVCLLVFRRLAVRFVAPWTATALTLALGASMPFGVFTRDPHSEVLVLLFVLGALLVLAEGRPSSGRYALAGVLAGATATARIDALLVCGGFVLAMVLVAIAAEGRVRAGPAAGALSGLTIGAGIGYTIGFQRSPAYVDDLSRQLGTQLAVTAVVVGMAAGIALLAELRHRGIATRAVERLRHPRTADVAATLVVVAGLAWWLLAPAVLELRRTPIELVSGLQTREGFAPDPGRSYGEQSLLRVAWHYGDLVVLAAVVGAGIAVRRAIRDRDTLLVLLLAVLSTSLPYLIVPRVTPDLPWAMRRFLPVLIPALLLLAGRAIDLTVDGLRGERLARGVARAAILVVVVAVPALVYDPVAGARNSVPMAVFVEQVCDAVDEDDTLLVRGQQAAIGIQTYATMCEGTDVAGLRSDEDPGPVIEEVAALDGRHGDLVVLGPRGMVMPDGVLETERREIFLHLRPVMGTLEHVPRTTELVVIDADLIFVRPS